MKLWQPHHPLPVKDHVIRFRTGRVYGCIVTTSLRIFCSPCVNKPNRLQIQPFTSKLKRATFLMNITYQDNVIPLILPTGMNLVTYKLTPVNAEII